MPMKAENGFPDWNIPVCLLQLKVGFIALE